MFPTYQGYLEQCWFTPLDAFPMPEKARVLITLIEDESTPMIQTKAQRQLEAVKRFIADTSGTDELSLEDYAELESGMYRFSMRQREFDL